MAYNPYNAIKGIYDLKGQWTEADKNKNTEQKKQFSETAKQYYEELRKNGYGDVADTLSKSDYSAAKSIVDAYKPQTVRTPQTMVNQENEKLFENYKKQLEDIRNTNPYETAEGKAILAKYDLAALQGRDNAVASGGATNGGNIDSFAAANALRQQAALVSQGQDAVLAAHQQKVNNAMSILESMGVHIDRVYNQDETSKNNQVDRDVKTAAVTGIVPESMSYSSNPYFNADGTLNDAYNSVEFDNNGGFQKIINDATEKLKTVTNSAEKANLEATIKYATQARAYKIKNSPAHSKWAHTLSLYAPDETADYKLANKEIDLKKYGIDKNAETSKYTTDANVKMNNSNNATELKIAGIEAQNNLDVVNAQKTSGEITQDASGTYVGDIKVGDKNGKPILSKDDAEEMYAEGNTSEQVKYAVSYYGIATIDGSNSPEIDYETALNGVYDTSSKTVQNYIRNVLKPYITDNTVTEEELQNHLITNSKEYDLEVKDLKAICEALDVDTLWVDNYKNSGLFGWGSGVKENK